jgi:hypothetical protein
MLAAFDFWAAFKTGQNIRKHGGQRPTADNGFDC